MMKWLHHYLGIWIIKYSKVQLKSGLSEGELVMWMRAAMGLGLVCAVKQETQLESGECVSTRAGRVWIWAMVKCLFVLHWCILGSFNFVTQLLSIVPFVGLEVPVYVCVCVCARSVVSYSFVTLWTVACQALLSMEFSRQEYWVASFWPRDRAGVSCTGRWILYHCTTWGAPAVANKRATLWFSIHHGNPWNSQSWLVSFHLKGITGYALSALPSFLYFTEPFAQMTQV